MRRVWASKIVCCIVIYPLTLSTASVRIGGMNNHTSTMSGTAGNSVGEAGDGQEAPAPSKLPSPPAAGSAEGPASSETAGAELVVATRGEGAEREAAVAQGRKFAGVSAAEA